MTIKYDNVFINDTALITGPYEAKGPLGKYFDKSYDDLYFGEDTWEQAESKLIVDSVELLLEKSGLNKIDIDIMISGDLLNQITASNYAAKDFPFPFIGIYAACATSTLGMAMAANMVSTKMASNVICTVSSHNNAAEKQFRYPVEYGGPKPKSTTFTSTGAAGVLISDKKSKIRIESSTVGSVVDSMINDVFNMGAVMAPAAAETIYKHFLDTGRNSDYYDLILTGDLGVYGKKILTDYIKGEYGISLSNYNDTGTLLYDLDKQPVYAGGSGPACLPLVVYGYIFEQMKKGKLRRVLLVATGALMSQTTANQKMTIPAIAHAISLEVA